MVGSLTAMISSTVRTPRFSISSTTRSLCTTWPRMAPRPPPAAKRFTFRSAMRTPEQKPYLAARLMTTRLVTPCPARTFWFVVGRWLFVVGLDERPTTNNQLQSRLHVGARPRAPFHPSLRDALDVR